MRDLLLVTDVTLTPASPAEVEKGLVGYVSCTLNGGIRLEGLTLRRARDGKHTISFPTRRDVHGRYHTIIKPLSPKAQREIEEQIFRALGIEQEAAP